MQSYFDVAVCCAVLSLSVLVLPSSQFKCECDLHISRLLIELVDYIFCIILFSIFCGPGIRRLILVNTIWVGNRTNREYMRAKTSSWWGFANINKYLLLLFFLIFVYDNLFFISLLYFFLSPWTGIVDGHHLSNTLFLIWFWLCTVNIYTNHFHFIFSFNLYKFKRFMLQDWSGWFTQFFFYLAFLRDQLPINILHPYLPCFWFQ